MTNGRLNRERTTEMLRQYKDHGIGGVFFHCRPGLITEYLADEFTMAELGEVTGDGRFRIGRATYDVVLIPPAINNWTSATFERIAEYLAAGGTIYSAGEPAVYLDGRKSGKPTELATKFASQWKQYDSIAAVVAALRRAVSPRIAVSDGGPLPENLLYRRHARPDGSVIYFFANPWETPLATDVRLEGKQLIALDTVAGTSALVPTTPEVAGQVAQLDLPPFGHALLVSLPQSGPAVDVPPPVQWQDVELQPQGITREQPNRLVIPFCDLDSGETQSKGINTTLADNMNFEQHECEKNIWSFTAQFRRALIDKQFPEDSGFTVDYHFDIAADAVPAVRDSLEIAVERPWLYEVTLNGQPVYFGKNEQWFDEDIRKTSIASTAKPGENTLRLAARPMHPLCEIMPVYVLGQFALEPASVGFTIVKPCGPCVSRPCSGTRERLRDPKRLAGRSGRSAGIFAGNHFRPRTTATADTCERRNNGSGATAPCASGSGLSRQCKHGQPARGRRESQLAKQICDQTSPFHHSSAWVPTTKRLLARLVALPPVLSTAALKR
ncbi:MAG: hypothetical protein R6U98_15475 [Pirellulaceae bacterium]